MDNEELFEKKVKKLIEEYGAPENITEELIRFLIEDGHGMIISEIGIKLFG